MVIHHPIHQLDRSKIAEMRRMLAPMKGSKTGPSAREMFDDLMEKNTGGQTEAADAGGEEIF